MLNHGIAKPKRSLGPLARLNKRPERRRVLERRRALKQEYGRQVEVSRNFLKAAASKSITSRGVERAMRMAVKKIEEFKRRQANEKDSEAREERARIGSIWELTLVSLSNKFPESAVKEAQAIRQSKKNIYARAQALVELTQDLRERAQKEENPTIKGALMSAYGLCLQEYSSVRAATKADSRLRR